MLPPLTNLEPKLSGLEDEYRNHFLREDVAQWTIVVGLWQIPVLAFSYVDYLFFGLSQPFYQLLLVRCVFFAYCIVSILLAKKMTQWRSFDRMALSVAMLTALFALYVMSYRPPNHAGRLVADVVVILVFYLVWPNTLVARVLPAALLSVGEFLGLIFGEPSAPPAVLYAVVIFFLLSNGLGLVASISLNNYRRGQFKAQKELEQANAGLQTIQRVQTQFISNKNAEELFGNLLYDLLTLTNSEFGFIGEILYAENGEPYLRDRAITDISWDEESRKIYQRFADVKGMDFYNIRGLWGTAILTGELVISNDPADDSRRSGMPEGHPPLHSFLGLPFHSEGKVIGMAGIANRPGGYDKEFVDFLQPYVTTCANIIEAYRNEKRRQEAVQELAAANAELERKVLDRTAELRLANERLVLEIEERKRAEKGLAAERQRLYGVLETLPVYVCLLDSDYHMPFANRYFRETFGESLGRRCYDFLFDRTEPCEICETYTVMKTGERHHWYWTGPNGRDYDIYDFPFVDEDGSALILEMGIDITDRRKAEEALRASEERYVAELEQRIKERTSELVVANEQLINEISEREQVESELQRSNAELQQFAYVASHDLREPLRMIASYVQLLQRRYRDRLDEDADDFIAYAVDGAKRMQGLIDGLLQYSRVGTHGKPFERVDCETVLEKALTNLQILIKESGAQVTHDPLPTVSADSTQLVQLFQNLIDNACKFRDDATPQIHVSARLESGQWLISVSDNGIGIDPEYAERIFIIFQRLHSREEFSGTGLGLAICKKIVERHGGRIWIEFGNRKGTTFCFTIPERVA